MRSERLFVKGFTLVELLIVVAIIAILAAIAVPNFLEAQVRAKVSRAKTDMRTLATAIEAYAVDNTKYPVPGDEEEGNPVVMSEADTEFFETRLSPSITTPVVYMTQRLLDRSRRRSVRRTASCTMETSTMPWRWRAKKGAMSSGNTCAR